jgi:hypothetical protein
VRDTSIPASKFSAFDPETAIAPGLLVLPVSCGVARADAHAGDRNRAITTDRHQLRPYDRRSAGSFAASPFTKLNR